MRVASRTVREGCTATPLPIEMTCGFLKKCIWQKKKHETRLKSYLSGAPLLWKILDPTLSLLHRHCKRVYGEDQQKVQLNWLNWWVHFKNTSSPVTRVWLANKPCHRVLKFKKEFMDSYHKYANSCNSTKNHYDMLGDNGN